MTIRTSLLFILKGDAFQQLITWQQQTDREVLRHQIESRGQALVVRLKGEEGLRKVSSLPEPGEAEPYYGAFGGAYRYTFHPLSGPQTGPFSSDQSGLTGPLRGGCELEILNQMGGFAYFYPTRIPPLRLFLSNPPELLRQPSDGNTGPLFGSSQPLVADDPLACEKRFYIAPSLYATLTQWGWYGRILTAYDFIFVPTTSSCLMRVRMRESGATLDLVKESII